MNANKKTAPVIFNDQALRFKNQDNLIASPILFQTVNTLVFFYNVRYNIIRISYFFSYTFEFFETHAAGTFYFKYNFFIGEHYGKCITTIISTPKNSSDAILSTRIRGRMGMWHQSICFKQLGKRIARPLR